MYKLCVHFFFFFYSYELVLTPKGAQMWSPSVVTFDLEEEKLFGTGWCRLVIRFKLDTCLMKGDLIKTSTNHRRGTHKLWQRCEEKHSLQQQMEGDRVTLDTRQMALKAKLQYFPWKSALHSYIVAPSSVESFGNSILRGPLSPEGAGGWKWHDPRLVPHFMAIGGSATDGQPSDF